MLSNYISSSHMGSGKTALVPVSQPGKSIILPRYYFALTTILTILSYAKMVKIAAIRRVFSPKIHHNAFAAGALSQTPLEELP